jgi:lysophospholipase L1-like esterase
MRAALVVVITAVIITLGTLEIGARWLYANIGSTADNTSYFARRWNAENEGGRNSLGFREREVTAKTDDIYRIAVVGDSLTYGQGLRLEDRFTERLDLALGDAVEVLNFGVPGANYDRLREIMATAIDTAAPDVVILQWFINDVEPPDERSPRALNLAGPLHRFVQPRSALYFLANRGFTQMQHDLGLVPSWPDYYDRFANPADGEPAVAARQRLEAVLDVAATACVAHGIALWPSMTDRETGFMTHDALFARVLEVCDARKLPCLDLRPALRTLPADAALVVSTYDAHPSALANYAVAEAMRQWLAGKLALLVTS